MNLSYKAVIDLEKNNAIHRSGLRMKDASLQIMIDHARNELSELEASPNDPTELADVFGCLLHYAVRQGWTLDMLEALMIKKFSKRFNIK